MMDVSKNELKALKIIFTDYLEYYNANMISKKLGISRVGALKLLTKIAKKGMLNSRQIGKSTVFKVNLDSQYAIKLIELALIDLSDYPSYAREVGIQIQNIFEKDAESLWLFGSILKRGKDAKDVDVCFVLKDPKNYKKIEDKIKENSHLFSKKIHPFHMTEEAIKENLLKHDQPLSEMVRSCIVLSGAELFVKVIKDVQKQTKGSMVPT